MVGRTDAVRCEVGRLAPPPSQLAEETDRRFGELACCGTGVGGTSEKMWVAGCDLSDLQEGQLLPPPPARLAGAAPPAAVSRLRWAVKIRVDDVTHEHQLQHYTWQQQQQQHFDRRGTGRRSNRQYHLSYNAVNRIKS